uniref:Uncharacterized protein n=1 Tax=Ditylenchus dipsaci TaxID=166011 RepID=A0A915E4V6_9BILA
MSAVRVQVFPSNLAKEVNRVKQDTTQTIVKPLQRSLSQTQLVSSMEEHKAEVVQQLLQICSFLSLEQKKTIRRGERDELYGFLNVIGPENARPRRKFQAGHISLLKYAQDNNREINFVAEMLTSFQVFPYYLTQIKLRNLFENVQAVLDTVLILEELRDTFKVVPDKLDSRLVFPEGTIARRGAQNLVRAHRSRDVLLLFPAFVQCFRDSRGDKCTNNLLLHKNVLKRIVELMSLISATEKIAMQRREERLMQEVFNIFNTNIFLDSIFED